MLLRGSRLPEESMKRQNVDPGVGQDDETSSKRTRAGLQVALQRGEQGEGKGAFRETHSPKNALPRPRYGGPKAAKAHRADACGCNNHWEGSKQRGGLFIAASRPRSGRRCSDAPLLRRARTDRCCRRQC